MSQRRQRVDPDHPRPAKHASIAATARRMLDLMSAGERRRLWLLAPLVMMNALIQVLGIASIMPFLALLSSPNAIQESAMLGWVYETLGLRDADSFFVYVGVGVLVVLVLSNAFSAWTQLQILRFSWTMHHTLGSRSLRTYLFKPYAFFLDQNSAGLAKNILSEVRQAVHHFLISGLNLIARTAVAVAVMTLLVVVEPLMALLTFSFFGASYGGIFQWVRAGMASSGRDRSLTDRERYEAASEALSGVKEIKVLGKEQPFLQRFDRPSRRLASIMTRQQIIAMLPRFAFETIAFGALIIIVLSQILRGEDVTSLLPTLGMYAFAAYRLLPALQEIFVSTANMRFSVASVEVLHRDLQIGPLATIVDRADVTPLPLHDALELRAVTFSFPNAPHALFAGLDLSIKANTTVALVGSTGAGKTTAVDLLLGLLRPQAGHLVVDGVVVNDTMLPAWQMSLGYVPQEIYLADDTVAGNIAFGVPRENIDTSAVERAARLANIHDFVTQELANGYETTVGERGMRLSGGQRQRLGIARALYHDPAVLFLDEGTSALDNVSEESIFRSVSEIGRSKTVVMIAHRISTIRDCDVIYVFDQGRVVVHGTYEQLLVTSSEFRALARVDGAAVAVGS